MVTHALHILESAFASPRKLLDLRTRADHSQWDSGHLVNEWSVDIASRLGIDLEWQEDTP